MKKKIISITSLVLFWTIGCMGQSFINIDFGKDIQGVQLSIAVSNNVIATGSEFIISAEIKNSSTNIIYLGESSPEMDFKVLLINDSGKTYQLTPNAIIFHKFMRIKLEPNEIRNWLIRVGVNRYFEPPALIATNKNIEPGSYTLKATRSFSVNNNIFELESNLLKVQIK